MPSLKRSVLPVIRKAQELSRVGFEIPIPLQLNKRTHRQNRGRCAAVIHFQRRQFPGEHCVMLLDGAGWLKAHELVIPSNMRLLPLPPYSPDLNPAEHVWEHIRESGTRNQVFDDLDQVMDVVEASLHNLHQTPEVLRSMTAFPWILEPAA